MVIKCKITDKMEVEAIEDTAITIIVKLTFKPNLKATNHKHSHKYRRKHSHRVNLKYKFKLKDKLRGT